MMYVTCSMILCVIDVYCTQYIFGLICYITYSFYLCYTKAFLILSELVLSYTPVSHMLYTEVRCIIQPGLTSYYAFYQKKGHSESVITSYFLLLCHIMQFSVLEYTMLCYGCFLSVI